MQDIIFKDTTQNREIPTRIYIPESHQDSIPTVIFGPGYQGQEELKSPNTKMVYKDYDFLAQYFIKNGHAFICIQHDITIDAELDEIRVKKTITLPNIRKKNEFYKAKSK